jgi:hypoxanthine phosphoribosyltransferase
VLALIESIEAREYKPDIVVGISRDGAVVSGMIASNLRLRPVANMDRIVEIQNGVGNIEILDCVAGELTNKKVLLVDSVCVTGWTLQELSKYLSTKRGAKVKTAVLFETTSPKLIEPDFYGMILKEEPVLPWQMTDIAKYRVRSHYRLYEDR